MLEHRAHKVAHFDQGDFRQVVDTAHGVFTGVAGAGGDMQVAIGFGHVDALVDRGDIGRAGERTDDAAGAQNRQSAENAQARIHGFQGQGFTVLNIDGDVKAAAVTQLGGQLLQMISDHLAGHRVDCRLAHTQHQPRTGHGADAASGDKTDTRFRAQAHPRVQQCPVGDVRIVARVLDGARFGAVFAQAAELQAHLHLFTFGQGDFYRVVAGAAKQQAGGGQAGGGGAAAGGQATAQRCGLFGGFVTHRGVWSCLEE